MGFITRMFGKNVESIESLAEKIASISIVCGDSFANNIIKDNDGNVTSTSDSVAFAANEFLYFLLHYVNRLAFKFGGVAAQEKIHNDISLYATAKLAGLMPEKSQSDYLSMFQDSINETEREYSKCIHLTSEGDENPKGTLFWEASKRISESAGGSMDIANIIRATHMLSAALSSFKSLKIEDGIKALAASLK